MIVSIPLLLEAQGRSAFHDSMADLFRAHRHDQAEAVLAGLLAKIPSETSSICLGLPARAVALSGWDAFNTQIEVISSRGQPVTAVGVDITDQGDAEDAEGRREQTLESSYYTDECGFAFSRASRDQIVSEMGKPRTAPWVGGFADLDGSLSVRGLAPLYDRLLHHPELQWSYMRTEAERLENLAAFLGSWFRHLRVHQAVKRGLEEHALARNIPLIVGTNEVAPYFGAVYYPTRTADYREAAAEHIEERQRAHRAAYAKRTEEQVADWREQRRAIRSWDPRVNPDQRRRYVEFAEASEKLARMDTPLASFDHGHKLSDAEFERMVQLYRHHRDPSAPPPPAAPPPALAQTAPRRLFGFGRRGL